jgi:hypothetical protein
MSSGDELWEEAIDMNNSQPHASAGKHESGTARLKLEGLGIMGPTHRLDFSVGGGLHLHSPTCSAVHYQEQLADRGVGRRAGAQWQPHLSTHGIPCVLDCGVTAGTQPDVLTSPVGESDTLVSVQVQASTLVSGMGVGVAPGSRGIGTMLLVWPLGSASSTAARPPPRCRPPPC